MWYVYVLRDRKGESYIGYTADLKRRLREHNMGWNKSTKGRKWELIYYEAYKNKSAATMREHRLKQDGRSRYQLMRRIENV